MSAAVGWAFPEIKPIKDAEFRRFQALIDREAGIFISEAKRPLLVGRLVRRLRELGLTSFGRYYDHVMQHGDDELRVLLNCISTNETHFFREPTHFAYLRNVVIPSWVRNGAASRRLRIWSAACSTGHEPYSIAMTVFDAFGDSSEFSFEIVASDISTQVLATARDGVYPIEREDEIPPDYRKAFMLKGRGQSAASM